MISNIKKIRFWHKWLGLLSAIFLINLGITGFILDHREWEWLYKDAISSKYFNNEFVANAAKHNMDVIKLSDSNNSSFVLKGGNKGLFWSSDKGVNWQKSIFSGRDTMPMITSIATDVNNSFTSIYISTSDGIWHSENFGKNFTQVVMSGQFVNMVMYDGGKNSTLIGVIDRTYPFRYEINSASIIPVKLSAPDEDEIPLNVTLSRFVRDLHYGRGVFAGIGSWLWSDIAGISLALLALSGLLFWLLPKYYIRKLDQKEKISAQKRKTIYQWLWRLHVVFAGLLASIPIIYLSLTGILIDHSKELNSWMKSTYVSTAYLPPVYSLRSLQGEIYSIASYVDDKNHLSIGTRYGLFDSYDNGETWKYNTQIHAFVMKISKNANMTFIKGMAGPDYIKYDGGPWLEMEKKQHMHASNEHCAKIESINWFDLIDGLHTGEIIASWWKWNNDIISIMAIIVVVTGLMRWWKRKWL